MITFPVSRRAKVLPNVRSSGLAVSLIPTTLCYITQSLVTSSITSDLTWRRTVSAQRRSLQSDSSGGTARADGRARLLIMPISAEKLSRIIVSAPARFANLSEEIPLALFPSDWLRRNGCHRRRVAETATFKQKENSSDKKHTRPRVPDTRQGGGAALGSLSRRPRGDTTSRNKLEGEDQRCLG